MSSHAPAFKVLTSAILFGTVGTAIAYAPENAGGSALGIGRLAIGAVLLLIFMPVFGGKLQHGLAKLDTCVVDQDINMPEMVVGGFDEAVQILDLLLEAKKLFESGVKELLVVSQDTSAYGVDKCPVGWEQVDMGNYYGCGSFGLNFYDNTLKLTFQTGAPGTPLVLKSCYPYDPNYRLQIEAKADLIGTDATFIHGEPYNYQRVIKGNLPAKREAFEVKGSMPDPEQLLALLFYQEIQKQGVRIDGGPISVRLSPNLKQEKSATPLLLHTEIGQKHEDIVFWTNQRSVNMFAEGLLRQIGATTYGIGTYDNGERVLDSLFLKWQLGPCGIVDGSGLSKVNRMSAAQFVKLLGQQCGDPVHRRGAASRRRLFSFQQGPGGAACLRSSSSITSAPDSPRRIAVPLTSPAPTSSSRTASMPCWRATRPSMRRKWTTWWSA